MWRKVVLAGVLGGAVMIVWAFVVNGMFWFTKNIAMKEIPDERAVYEVLKKNIVAPGRYVCNPALTPTGFPLNEPVFGITYSGTGHEAAGPEQIRGLVIGFLSVVIAAWMLSVTSDRILSSYFRKVLYITAIGLLFVVSAFFTKFNIDGYPLHDTLLLAAYDLFTWFLLGLVIAWRIKPEPGRAANS